VYFYLLNFNASVFSMQLVIHLCQILVVCYCFAVGNITEPFVTTSHALVSNNSFLFSFFL